jgi:uncharacterized RDD family membrane protein YckC
MIWEIDEEREVIEGLDEDGRPDPSYAAALGLRPAPLGRRALASIIEFALYALLQLPYWLGALPSLLAVATGALSVYGLLNHPSLVWMIVAASVSFVLTLAFLITQLALHGRRGVTLGKAFTGIRSVDVKRLAKPGFGRALLRGVLLWASFLVPVVGPALFFVSPLFDGEKRGRGWLDKAAGTWFVDVRHGLDPYHEKRMRIARKTVAAEPESASSQLPSLATPTTGDATGYRPGARLSSGVVGAARAAEPGTSPRVEAPSVRPAAPSAEPAAPTPEGAPGGPRLGGYRPGDLSGQPRPAAPEAPTPPLAGGIVDSIPGRDGRLPAAPAAGQAPAAPLAPAQAPAEPSPINDETVIDPELEGEIDDRTVRRVEIVEPDEDLEATRARPRPAASVATLAFDHGERFAITGAALIGRNPAPSSGEVVEHLLPIADDTRSISKTHLLITAQPLAAVDRASTNGSSVVRAGAEHPLAPGEAFALAPGDVVRFGDRSLTVEAAS